jgi:magnesium transporter
MRVDVLRVKPRESVQAIRRKLKGWEGYSRHIIVETEDGVFFGVIPVEILLSAPRTARAEDLAIGAETVDIDTDSEEVARLFAQYSPEIVVVLERGKVLGTITAQEAIPLLEKEHAEDVAKIFSMRGIEHVWTPVRKAVKNRTPWLIINLFTAFLAASVVSIFESTIRTFALLAVFMPIVPGEAGNATTQTMAIVVRGLATGELDKTALRRVFWKEFVLGLLNGIIVGVIALAFALIWKENLLVALALALAMPLALIVAGLIGVAIPIVLKKLGQDPASSSTIILTTFTDMAGFFTFLGIATVLMRIMGV